MLILMTPYENATHHNQHLKKRTAPIGPSRHRTLCTLMKMMTIMDVPLCGKLFVCPPSMEVPLPFADNIGATEHVLHEAGSGLCRGWVRSRPLPLSQLLRRRCNDCRGPETDRRHALQIQLLPGLAVTSRVHPTYNYTLHLCCMSFLQFSSSSASIYTIFPSVLLVPMP